MSIPGAKILAIANQKGGVGKTTTALTLAAALAARGRRTLVLDLDPHACASVHLAIYPECVSKSAVDLFKNGAPAADTDWDGLILTHRAGFDVVPGHIRVSDLDMDLRDAPGKGMILKRRLEFARGRYDYIVMDCPPHVGVVLVNALVASDLLVIPVQTDFLALHGLRLIFDTVRALNRALPRPIRYRALATMFDRRASACKRALEMLRAKLGGRMFETVIDLDTNFREASAQGKVIFEVAPKSKGAVEYRNLAEEIERHEVA